MYIYVFFSQYKRADIYRGYSFVYTKGNLQSNTKKIRILSVDVHATLQMYQISKLFKRTIVTKHR